MDPSLLGDYLEQLAAAAEHHRRLEEPALERCRSMGRRAAEDGVPLRQLVDLYLSATWRAWEVLPAVVNAEDADDVRQVGAAVLHAADDAAAAAADGYQVARRWIIRREEAARREFVDDLLMGGGDPASLFARAELFGLDLAAPHAVAVVVAEQPFRDATPAMARLGDALTGSAGAECLAATKDGRAVLMLPAGGGVDIEAVLAAVLGAMHRLRPPGPGGRWRLGLGRPGNGPGGVVRSYEEAGDAVHLADRLELPGQVARARDLLVFRVLLRDRQALDDLIQTVLLPLTQARGGAGPLLDTVLAYAAHGGNATATARSMHLSVRALTYRLQRIAELSGYDPARPDQLYVLYTAALGARLAGVELPSLLGDAQVRGSSPSTIAASPLA